METFLPGTQFSTVTLPPIPGWHPQQSADFASSLCVGDSIHGWRITRTLFTHNDSTFFRVVNDDGLRAVLKLLPEQKAIHPDALNTYRQVQIPNMPTLYDYGKWQNSDYLVMQLLSGEPLDSCRISSDEVIKEVIPGLSSALSGLHSMGLLHNDVKPDNILWSTESQNAWLIDLDTITLSDCQDDVGGTPAYMAPELLFSGAKKKRSSASDICSLALTLVELFSGESLIKVTRTGNGAVQQARYFWQKDICLPSSVPADICPLIQKSLELNPCDRPSASVYSKSSDQTTRASCSTVLIRPFRIGNKNAISIQQFLGLTQDEWSYTTKMLASGYVSSFLTQFGGKYYTIAERYREMAKYNPNGALFRLTQELHPCQAILWKGHCYATLLDLCSAAPQGSETPPLESFLAAKCLSFYFIVNEQSSDDIAFAKTLELPRNANAAAAKLRSMMQEDIGFVLEDKKITTLHDLAEVLTNAACEGHLDKTVAQLLQSHAFAVWMEAYDLADIIQKTLDISKGAQHEQ